MRLWLAYSGDDDVSPDFYTTEKRAKDALRSYTIWTDRDSL
jgi:hypothetical protein